MITFYVEADSEIAEMSGKIAFYPDTRIDNVLYNQPTREISIYSASKESINFPQSSLLVFILPKKD